MANEKDKAKRWRQTTIRELLLLVAVIAIAVGWWIDHARLTKEVQALKYLEYEQQLRDFTKLAKGYQIEQ